METKTKGSVDSDFVRAAQALVDSSYSIALTGAGMSVESGIPPFRGPGGLWTKRGEPPMNAFQLFLADPKRAWEERLRQFNEDELYTSLRAAQPNAGHYALVELERLGVIRCVITQNVDDLHRMAGQKSLVEIHGNYKLLRCLECVSRFPFEQFDLNELPPRCPNCGGLVKSDTVSFGEPIPPDVLAQCEREAAQADLVLLVGTSASVYPAAGFALEVKRRGGQLIEVNLYDSEITALCDICLRGPSGEALPRLAQCVAQVRMRRAL